MIWIAEPTVSFWLDVRKASVRGFVTRTLFREDGQRLNYVVFVPHVPLPKECDGYPVLMFLNGFGENGDDGLLQISNNFGRRLWELQETFPFIAVAPQCSINGSWVGGGTDAENAMAILDRVLTEYVADKDRVYLTGVSSGGTGVLEFATRYPERFAAVVPVAATPGGGAPEMIAESLADQNMPLWSFFNGGDETSVVDWNRSLRKAMYEKGCDSRFTEYNRPTHNAWDYAYRDPAMYEWLRQQSCAANRRRGKFAMLSNATRAVDEPLDNVHTVTINETGALYELAMESTFESPIRLIFQPSGEEERPLHESASYTIGLSSLAGIDGALNPALDSAACGLLGQASIRKGDWNHVSIKRTENGRIVTINGWPGLEQPVSQSLPPGTGQTGVAVALKETGRSEVRELRFRNLASGGPPPSLNIQPVDLRGRRDGPGATLDTVVTALRERSKFATSQWISWKPREHANAAYLPFTIAGGDQPAESLLSVNTGSIRSISYRRDPDPQRSPATSIGLNEPPTTQYRPAMLYPFENKFEFSTAIDHGFTKDQAVAGPWQQFERIVTHAVALDWLKGEAGICSKVAKRPVLFEGPATWARLTPERFLPYQIDSLHQQAAALGLGALDRPPLSVDYERLELVSSFERVAGHPCICLRETHPEDPNYHRYFWIDESAGGLVRRFWGRVLQPDDSFEFEYKRPLPTLLGDTFIEIAYDTASHTPEGWWVISCQSPQSPLRAVAHASVNEVGKSNAEATAAGALGWATLPASWVVDYAENRQFINRSSGSRRGISSAELACNPTWDELVGPGNALLDGDGGPNKAVTLARGSMALIGAVCIGAGLIGLCHRRRRAL